MKGQVEKKIPKSLIIEVFSDGENVSPFLEPIINSWIRTWNKSYKSSKLLEFTDPHNIKQGIIAKNTPLKLNEIARIRNPDCKIQLN